MVVAPGKLNSPMERDRHENRQLQLCVVRAMSGGTQRRGPESELQGIRWRCCGWTDQRNKGLGAGRLEGAMRDGGGSSHGGLEGQAKRVRLYSGTRGKF